MAVPQHIPVSRTAAYLAAPLWAAQALVWTIAPKVQEQSPPYRITDVPLFELFWLSVAAAVGLSATAALAMPAYLGTRPTRLFRTGTILTRIAVGLAVVAAVSAAVAPVRSLQEPALTIMTNALYGAMLLLAAGLTAYAVAVRDAGRASGAAAKLPTVLAVLTVVTIVAILASGTSSAVGLYLAVAVVVLVGIAWFAWGNALAGTRPRPVPAPA